MEPHEIPEITKAPAATDLGVGILAGTLVLTGGIILGDGMLGDGITGIGVTLLYTILSGVLLMDPSSEMAFMVADITTAEEP